jgi:hypothetical protein
MRLQFDDLYDLEDRRNGIIALVLGIHQVECFGLH